MENGDYKNDPMKRLVYKHDVIVALAEKIDEPIDFVEALKNVPVVDVVKVVRCKDCIHNDQCKHRVVMWVEDPMNTWHKDIDYCSYGERKDDE